MDILGGMNVVTFAEALLKLTDDPKTFKANLAIAKDMQASLDAKEVSLREREDKVAVREQAVLALDQTETRLNTLAANLAGRADKIDIAQSELAAAKASHAAEVAKSLKALDDRRLDILNTQQTVDAKAAEQQKTSVELQGRALALEGVRAALASREMIVKEGEAALAARQERFAKAMQGV